MGPDPQWPAVPTLVRLVRNQGAAFEIRYLNTSDYLITSFFRPDLYSILIARRRLRLVADGSRIDFLANFKGDKS